LIERKDGPSRPWSYARQIKGLVNVLAFLKRLLQSLLRIEGRPIVVPERVRVPCHGFSGSAVSVRAQWPSSTGRKS